MQDAWSSTIHDYAFFVATLQNLCIAARKTILSDREEGFGSRNTGGHSPAVKAEEFAA